jgi:hypothetical protein
MIDMTSNKPMTLQQHAMRFGTLMGLFWILKFILLPVGFTIPLLQLLFLLLTLFVPILGYIYVRKYRERECGGELNFLQAFAFTSLMYLFAIVLVAMAHYIYFRFIDNGFIVNTCLEQLENIKYSVSGEMETSVDQMIEALNLAGALSPKQIMFQFVAQNLFYCGLITIPTALLATKRKKQF